MFEVCLFTLSALNLIFGFYYSYKKAETVCVVKVLKLDPVKTIEKAVATLISEPEGGILVFTIGVLTAVGVYVQRAAIAQVAEIPAYTTLIFTAVKAA